MFNKRLKKKYENLEKRVEELEKAVVRLLEDKHNEEDFTNPPVMGGRK